MLRNLCVNFVVAIFLGLLSTALIPAAYAETASGRLLIFGDSLVAGYGLPPGESFPDKLQESLNQDGIEVQVINGGVSGDTSAGGASRIAWSLADKPSAVVVVLGGNDALRGLPPDDLERNLDSILRAIQTEGIPVLLAGMQAPANLGIEYGKAFNAAFMAAMDKARERQSPVLFYPFFLDGVALEPRLNQGDGIHPNEQGVAVIVGRIRPTIDALLALAPAGG